MYQSHLRIEYYFYFFSLKKYMYQSTDFSEYLPFCQEAMTEGWRALSFRNVLEVVGVPLILGLFWLCTRSLLTVTHTAGRRSDSTWRHDHVPLNVAARFTQVCQ